MGVEFYTCNYCGETFSDCGGFVGCECGTKWCDDECAESDGYISEHCSLHPDLDDYDLMYDYREKHCNCDSCYECEHYVKASCKYCRQEDFDDGVLLEYTLNLLNMSREEIINRYKIEQDNYEIHNGEQRLYISPDEKEYKDGGVFIEDKTDKDCYISISQENLPYVISSLQEIYDKYYKNI